jgi:hypothetical protein
MLSSVRLVVIGRQAKDSNEVARRSDQRFGALKASLPARGVVGYVGESGAAAVGDYYLAEYALAPLIVDHSPNHEWVVGNFPEGSPPTAPEQDLQLIKDFGNGVLLFSNQGAN